MSAAPPPAPTVAVPVFNALAETRACIRSVLECTEPPYSLLLIDDASTDTEVAAVLQDHAVVYPHVDLVLNGLNRGYTAVVNQACRRASGDVVLLNSDTIVTPRWLEKLRSAALSRERVATVTPVSNAAGAFSVPESNVNSELPDHLSPAAMAELVERLSSERRPVVPTGNGFCMYVTRAALDEVGLFDEENFPRGYGEENDFCMRAVAAGFVNLIDDSTFVYHKRGASFGESRDPLVAGATERLRALHPTYKARVNEFLAADPIADLRAGLGAALDEEASAPQATPERPAILYIVHSGGGGTRATNLDLADAVSNDYRALVLSCDRESWTLSEQGRTLEQLERFEFSRPWEGHKPLSPDRRRGFRRVCSDYGVALVHIRHLLGSGEGLIAEAKDQGLPVVFSFHDFYTVCPTIHLLDERGHYCGGHCTAGPGDCAMLQRWFSGMPPLKHRFVHVWRERLAGQLERCDAFVTTSATARSLVTEHYPFLADRVFPIIEHGREPTYFEPVAEPPAGDRLRVVCPGALGRNKGIDLISELMQLDQAEGPRFEFHFVGKLARSFTPDRFGGILHGEYERNSLASVLAGIQPSFALIAPNTPETYCHTLTEAWMCGVPVLASNIGTIRERVRRGGGGWLLDYTDARSWYDDMRRIDLDDWHARRAEIDAMRFPSVQDMAAQYRDLYRQLIEVPSETYSGV